MGSLLSPAPPLGSTPPRRCPPLAGPSSGFQTSHGEPNKRKATPGMGPPCRKAFLEFRKTNSRHVWSLQGKRLFKEKQLQNIGQILSKLLNASKSAVAPRNSNMSFFKSMLFRRNQETRLFLEIAPATQMLQGLCLPFFECCAVVKSWRFDRSRDSLRLDPTLGSFARTWKWKAKPNPLDLA